MPGIHEINLIPAEILEKRMSRQRIKKWLIFIICQILCFCLLGIIFYSILRKLESEAAILRRHDLEVKQTESELMAAYQSMKELLERREFVLKLTKKHCLTPILLSLAQVMDPKTKLARLWIEKGKINDQGEMEIYYNLKLWGISQSYQNLSNFFFHLQQDTFFQEIKLIKSDIDEKEKSFIRFEVSLIYYEKGRPGKKM